MNELQLRVAATQATERRFAGRPFDWSKQATCIHLFRFHAAQMGHQLPIVPRFRSALGAKRALLAQGVETLPELIDKFFPRIPASEMRTGDVAVFPGEEGGMSGLMVYGQLRAVFGFHAYSDGCSFARLSDEGFRLCEGAWRVWPK